MMRPADVSVEDDLAGVRVSGELDLAGNQNRDRVYGLILFEQHGPGRVAAPRRVVQRLVDADPHRPLDFFVA